MLARQQRPCTGLRCRPASLPCNPRGCCWRLRASKQALPARNAFTTLYQRPKATASNQLQPHGSTTAVTTRAYLNSDDTGGGGGAAQPSQLRVLVVGASPVGLAAGVALAQQAGCAVEVHDSRADPLKDKHADNSSTLIGLGKRGLEALSNLPLTPPDTAGGRAVISIPTQQPPNTGTTGSSGSHGRGGGAAGAAAHSAGGLWAPGSANLGVLNTSSPGSTKTTQPQAPSGHNQGLGMAELNPEPLPGLTLLQGLVVMGPQGQRREVYSRPASRSKPERSVVTGGATAGIAAIDELSLTCRLLSAAAALSSSTTPPPAQSPQLVLPGAQTLPSQTATESTASTPIPQGPTTAPSAEAAQEAAMPPTVPAPGTTASGGRSAGTAAAGATQLQTPAAGLKSSVEGKVEVHYGSHLTLLDTANKTATFMSSGGAAQVSSYDLLVAADAAGGGHLVVSALQELQDRQQAHRHPTAAAVAARASHQTAPQSAAAAGASDVHSDVHSELEFRAWQDLPSDPELAALLGDGAASRVSSTAHLSSTPQQGWLLVWSGHGAQQLVRPGLSSAGGNNVAPIPGAPSCTVMAWPSKGGATWSGCVFTDPQVFEALRSQSDYEQLLRSVSAPAAGGGVHKLPALWVAAIAAQMKRSDRVGRVPSPVSAPPHSIAAPTPGLVCLSAAAVASHSPQLLNPNISVGLTEAAALAGLVAEGTAGAGGVADKAEGLRHALATFDQQYGPEAQALHKLTAQLSWLRHAFSPAAPAAAASVPVGSLAWIGAVLGAPRTGMALQWKCLLAILPAVTALQRFLLYKLGLGRPEKPAVVPAAAAPDASYRSPKAAGLSTSMDSGVHVDSSSDASSSAEAQTVAAAALSAVSGVSPLSGQGPAHSLGDVAAGIEPCGQSLLAYVHTTDMPPSGIWRLLQAAPLLASLLWGALFWAAAQALRWGMWAFRAWGWAQSGVA